jgi:RNA recognition motif-containing protein
MDGNGRRSKGCGVVEYQQPKEAARAIRELNESLLEGRKIFVQPHIEKGNGNGNDNASGNRENSHSSRNNNNNNRDHQDSFNNHNHNHRTNTRLFVGNLSYDCTWQDLKDFFKPWGYVQNAQIMELNGRKKGFGIVEYENPADAMTALRRLEGSQFQGRTLDLHWDREQPTPNQNNNNNQDRNNRNENENTHTRTRTLANQNDNQGACQIYVGNLSYDCSWQDLKDLFRPCGGVAHAQVVEGKDGNKKGFGIVKFDNSRQAHNAISQVNGQEFQGRKLDVRLDHKQDPEWDQGQPRHQQDNNFNNNRNENTLNQGVCLQIYVGNLSYDCSWQDLKDLFRPCGGVAHAEIIEGKDGRKKGFGIVKFANYQQAHSAIAQFNGQEFQGRKLDVRLDHKAEHDSKPRPTFKRQNKDSALSVSDPQLYVGNLSYDCCWQDLKDLFKKYGPVEHANVIEGGNGKKKGFGIVRFSNSKNAKYALEKLNGVEFQQRKLEVRWDRTPEKLDERHEKPPRNEKPSRSIMPTTKPTPTFNMEDALGSALSCPRT